MSIPWDRAASTRGRDAGRHPSATPWSASTRRPRRVLSWCMALVLGAALAVLPHVDGVGGSAVPVMQALLPVLCCIALLVVFGFAVFRRLLAALILLAATVLAAIPAAVHPASGQVAAQIPQGQDRHSFAVLSLNLRLGQADVAATAAKIRDVKPVAVAFTEATEGWVKRLMQEPDMGRLLPHRTGRLPESGASGTAILASVPLTEQPQIWPAGRQRFEQRVAVLTPPKGQPVRIAAVHTIPPVSADAGPWRTDLHELGRWQRAHRDLPLVMAGDFNASQAHPAFRAAASELADAAADAGPFPLPTWPSGGSVPAFSQIDHLLTARLETRSWATFTVDGTDHHGVGAVFAGAPAGPDPGPAGTP